MAGIPDKTIIFRKFDLWWPLLTSIFTWAKKWLKWLRTGSLRAVDLRIARPSSFPSFRVRGGHLAPPPPWRRWLRPPPGRGLMPITLQCRSRWQGLCHADENGGGGGGRGPGGSEARIFFRGYLTHTKNRKLSGFGPLFSWKMGEYPPHSQKWGGTCPPSPL